MKTLAASVVGEWRKVPKPNSIPVTGFVLAGGSSRRMGRDKAKLMLGGETMVERQLRLLLSVCRSVAILGPPKNFEALQVIVLPDEFPGRGPLAGLYTALHWSSTEFNLFRSCDLPFMESGFLHFLCQRAAQNRADVTVPISRTRRPEPLAAIYRRRALSTVRQSLEAAKNKMSCFYSQVHCDRIRWSEITRAGFGPRIFDNMNTPEDFAAAKRILKLQQGANP